MCALEAEMDRSARIMARRSVKLIAIIMTIIFDCSITISRAYSQGIEWYVAPIEKYKAGRLSESREIIQKHIDQVTDDKEKFWALDLLADQCINTYNLKCIQETINQINPLADKAMDKNIAKIYKLWYASVLSGTIPEIEQSKLSISKNLLKDISWMANVDSYHYTRIQLRTANLLRTAGRYNEASEAVRRSIISFFNIPAQNNYYVALVLLELINSFIAEGDTYKAIKWAAVSDPFFQAIFPKDGPDYASYLVLTANLMSSFIQFDTMASSYEKALDASLKIDYNPDVRETIIGQLICEYAVVLAAGNHIEKALQILDKHPYKNIQESIFKGLSNSSPLVIIYAAANIIVQAKANLEIDGRWKQVIINARNKIGDINFESYARDYTRYARDYIDFAYGVMEAQRSIKEGFITAEPPKYFSSAAISRIDNLKQFRERNSESFPLLNLWDRILVEFGILAGAHTQNADLVISGSEVIERNLQSYLTDAKSLVAAQENESKRQIAKTWMKRISQRGEWEVAQLKNFLNESLKKENLDANEQFKIKYNYAQNSKIENEERNLINGVNTKPFLPNLARLQSSLNDGEAFIRITAAVGQIVKYCVNKDSFIISASKNLNQEQWITSIKSVENSLHYSGSNDAEGAMNYPVNAAAYVWKEISEGINPCLEKSKMLIISTPEFLRGIPIESLIKSLPENNSSNVSLKDVDWVGLRWPIAYADSAQAFIASRQIVNLNKGDLAYFGVGDPKFDDKNLKENKQEIMAYARGSSTPTVINLRELGELPSTKKELSTFNAAISDSENLLMGKSATELAFRSKQLSRYDILHFATHALIRQEIPGVNEPSLVFTPDNDSETINDGLLSASEISALNLNARIAILSACNSAKIDPQFFGGQLGGLSNAFSFAGVPTIIASLWELNDEATYHLMEYMSEGIKNNGSRGVSEIHNEALTTYIKDSKNRAYLHPRFWASLVVLGDGSVPFFKSIKDNSSFGYFHLTGSNDGDIVSLSKSDKSVITSEIGEFYPENKRFSSIVRKMNNAGNILWEIEDKNIGASKLLVTNYGIISTGYRGDEKTTPVVRILDNETGRKINQFSFNNVEGIPFGIFSDSKGLSLLVEDIHFKKRTLISFSMDGAVIRSKDISLQVPVKQAAPATFAKLLPNSDFLVVEIDSDNSSFKIDGTLDEFGLINQCLWKYKSIISKYNKNGDNLNHDLVVDGYRIKNITDAENGGYLLSGQKIQDCQYNGYAAVLYLDSSGNYKEIWRDSYKPSEAVGSFYRNDKLVVIETKTEPVRLYLTDKPPTWEESVLKKQSNFNRIGDSIEKVGLNVIEVNLSNSLEKRAIYTSGLSDAATGFNIYGKDAYVYGHTAGHPSVMNLH